MTAEQALIEENKKDPRVRCITQDHNNNIEFWQHTPFFNTHFNGWYDGSLISKINNCIDIKFKQKEYFECILCIDDIKQEIPPIPGKWYIEFTEENFMILDSWRKKKASLFLKTPFLEKCFLLSDDYFKDGSFYVSVSIGEYIPEMYEKITLEQFKKYVLCEGEEKQEEKRIENHPIMSIAESELFQKEKLFVKNDTSIKIEQTIFYSTRCWIEDRINYINKFIRKNIDSDLCIPIEWVEERNELIEKLKNL